MHANTPPEQFSARLQRPRSRRLSRHSCPYGALAVPSRHRLRKRDATTSMPPATPPAMMTVAMTTRRRTQGIDDHDPSFLNHYVQAASGARIKGIASIGAEVRARPAAAATALQIRPAIAGDQSPFIGCFLFAICGFSPCDAPTTPRAWFSGERIPALKSILSTSAYRAWRSRPPR